VSTIDLSSIQPLKEYRAGGGALVPKNAFGEKEN